MRKLLLFPIIFILLILNVVGEQEGTVDFLGFSGTMNNANATVDTFTNIDSFFFNLNVSHNLSFFVTLGAQRLGSQSELSEFEIVFDGQSVISSLITLDANEQASVLLFDVAENVGPGDHNFTIRHRREGAQIVEVRSINFFITTRFSNNETHASNSVGTFNVSSQAHTSSNFIKLVNGTFNVTNEPIVFFRSNINPDSTTFVDFIVQVNGQNSTARSLRALNSDETEASYIFNFDDLGLMGNTEVALWGRTRLSTSTIYTDTRINILNFNNSEGDTIKHNFKNTSRENFLETEFIAIGNITMNISLNKDLFVYSTMQVEKISSGGNPELITFISIVNGGIQENLTDVTISFKSAVGDINIIPNMHTFQNITTGENTIIIYARVTLETFNVTDLSIFTMETERFTELAAPPPPPPADNPPNVTLTNPLDNSNINFIDSINLPFSCVATDDNNIDNITYFSNSSGTFQAVETSIVSDPLTSVNFTHNQTFINSIVILWNCLAIDNSSQSSFADQNFTVTLNRTIIPFVDVTPPNVTLVSPGNNTNVTATNNNVIFFYNAFDNVSLINNCSLFIDSTLNRTQFSITTNATNNFTVSFGANQSLEWFVTCEDVAGVGSSGTFNLNVLGIEGPIEQVFEVGGCPDTIPEVLLIATFLFISFVLIIMGFMFRIDVLGFFGALLLLVLSWFIASCIFIFAFLLASISIILAVMFMWRGLTIPTDPTRR